MVTNPIARRAPDQPLVLFRLQRGEATEYAGGFSTKGGGGRRRRGHPLDRTEERPTLNLAAAPIVQASIV